MRDKPAPVMGVYRILNTVTNEAYIGSSTDLDARRAGWHATLRSGRRCPILLRAAVRRYGPDAFRFEVIERVTDRAQLLNREQAHIEACGWLTYNTRTAAPGQLNTLWVNDPLRLGLVQYRKGRRGALRAA